MATQVETRNGSCASHGPVEATREMPKPGFPYLVYIVRRTLAAKRPFRCPTCGEAVTVDKG
jgi:hypothetical protein